MGATAELFLGIDVGTSGVRCCAIDRDAAIVADAQQKMPAPDRSGAAVQQNPQIWWEALLAALAALGRAVALKRVRRISVDATSGTLLLIDARGRPLTPGLMYNDARARAEAARVAEVAPPESGAHGPTSALAKLLHLAADEGAASARFAVHQADWIAGNLIGHHGASDENNALKLGYDPVSRAWPGWFGALGVDRELLPQVHVPGTVIGRIAPVLCTKFGFPGTAEICAGTTDGVAAFIATRATDIGDAVTSLGSTLTLKILSDRPIFAPALGVYSHRLGERWLAGGASNSGGAALLAHFSAEEIAELSMRLQPDAPTGLDYYPLPAPGERFPISDPSLPSRTEPRPDDPAQFLQALFEGVAGVEALGYRRLAELGAPALRRVLTVGGGAGNAAWTAIRARLLGVPVSTAATTESAYGAALLALHAGTAS
jgi:sugar (pentulose or hexulose) kinase